MTTAKELKTTARTISHRRGGHQVLVTRGRDTFLAYGGQTFPTKYKAQTAVLILQRCGTDNANLVPLES